VRLPDPTEHDIQTAILRYLAVDGRVAWAERFNTGAHVIETPTAAGHMSRRFIRYAFPGCADILGQLCDGRFLAVEVKTRTGRATREQAAFPARVQRYHGGGCTGPVG